MTARHHRRSLAHLATWAVIATTALVAIAGGVWLSLRSPPGGTLRIGYRVQPPFYFASEGKRPDGIAVDVLS